ncbi:hypothetical protein D3C86_2169280 [compost metagenome]
MVWGQLLQHLGIRRISRLRLLDDRQAQLHEQDFPQLLRRVKVEFGTANGINLRYQPGNLGFKFLPQVD